MLTVVVVPETVKLPATVTLLENAPVVPETALEPPVTAEAAAVSTYVLFAASVPDTGVATSLIKF